MKVQAVFKQFRRKIKHIQNNLFYGEVVNTQVLFKNGYGISISKSDHGIYCSENTVEIAPLNQKRDLFPFPGTSFSKEGEPIERNIHPCLKAVGITSDQVKGWVDQKELKNIIQTISRF